MVYKFHKTHYNRYIVTVSQGVNMIPNRKLVRIAKNNYYFLIDGNQVAKGPLSWCKAQLAKYGIQAKDIDFAVEVMVKNNDSVADFGINGGFIISQKFKDAHLGPNNMKHQEAQ